MMPIGRKRIANWKNSTTSYENGRRLGESARELLHDSLDGCNLGLDHAGGYCGIGVRAYANARAFIFFIFLAGRSPVGKIGKCVGVPLENLKVGFGSRENKSAFELPPLCQPGRSSPRYLHRQ